MASSSHKKEKYYAPIDQIRELTKGEEERERDWLELGLGLGFSSSGCKKQHHDQSYSLSVSATAASSPSPSSPFYANQYQQIGLGLEYSMPCFGFDDKDEDQNNNYDNDDNYDMPYSWQTDSGSFIDWKIRPVFNDSHDYYYERRQPHPGFWFTLRSTTSRSGEAVLPQIPKAHIRVKDENVMVLVVKKYLVRKLGLSNEAEIEISCMGEKLLQWQTLKHVRDSVWLPRMRLINSTTTLLSESTSLTYLLPLHYCRNTDIPPFLR
ncbi:hypothetical protein ACOSQ3_028962 [Xanthoceras sorbifolium]